MSETDHRLKAVYQHAEARLEIQQGTRLVTVAISTLPGRYVSLSIDAQEFFSDMRALEDQWAEEWRERQWRESQEDGV